MPRIQIDGHEYAPPGTPTAWRDLLAGLDRELDARGLLLTDVRFDGLDEPAFRNDPALDRPLDEFAVIEVASSTPVGLVNRCLDDVAASLPALAQAAREIGEQFRGFDIAGANGALVELAEGVSTLMSLVGTAGNLLGVDLNALVTPDGTVGARVQQLTGHVEALVAAQQQEDWLTVADVLEYDLAPALDGFGPALDAFEPAPTAKP